MSFFPRRLPVRTDYQFVLTNHVFYGIMGRGIPFIAQTTTLSIIYYIPLYQTTTSPPRLLSLYKLQAAGCYNLPRSCNMRVCSRTISRLPGGGAPGRQTTTPDYHMRICSRTRSRIAARLHCVSHKQQEDNVYAAGSSRMVVQYNNSSKSYKSSKTWQNFVKFSHKTNLNPQKTLLFSAKYAIIYI